MIKKEIKKARDGKTTQINTQKKQKKKGKLTKKKMINTKR